MKLVVIGAGGLGRVVAEVLARAGEHEVIGFLDDAVDCSIEVSGLPVLGTSGKLTTLAGEGVAGVAVAIGRNEARLALADKALAAGLTLPMIVDPTSVVSGSATLGEGTFIGPHAVIGSAAPLGRLVVVGAGAVIEHDAVLAEGCYVGPRCLVDARATVARVVRLEGGSVVAQDAKVPQ